MKASPVLALGLPLILALAGCGRTGPETGLDLERFAFHNLAIVDFGGDSSAFRADFPVEALPARVTRFHGKDWEVSGFAIRLLSPMGGFVQFDCSRPRNICVVAGGEIGLDSNAYYQFPPGKRLLAFVSGSRGDAGNLGRLPHFRLGRKQAAALRSRLYEMDVAIAESKVGHTPLVLSLGGYFDRNRYSLDSLAALLREEGARFVAAPAAVDPAEVFDVSLSLVSEQTFGRVDDTSGFPFSATVTTSVKDRRELIEMFLGPEAAWEKGGDPSSGCDCKYAWYTVNFHLKSRHNLQVEIDPCGQGFRDAIRMIQGEPFTLKLSPEQSGRMRGYFLPLMANQKRIGKAARGAAHPCSG